MIIMEVDDDDAGEEEGVDDGGEEIGSKKEKKGERIFYVYKGKNVDVHVHMDEIISLQRRWYEMSEGEQRKERERVKNEEGRGRLPQGSKTSKGSDVTICYPWILNRLTTKEITREERHKEGDANFIKNLRAALDLGQIGERVKKVFDNGFLKKTHTLEQYLAAFGITDANSKLVEDVRYATVKYNKDRRSEQREVMITCSCANMVCQAPIVDGVHRAPASSLWFNDENERVSSFPEGGNYIYSGCIRIPCACTNENCQATVDVDGVHREPASSRWFNDKNERVTSFPEGRKYIYGGCIRIPCACTNVNCQATVDVDGVHREPASCNWFNDKNELVTSFPEGRKYIYGGCIRTKKRKKTQKKNTGRNKHLVEHVKRENWDLTKYGDVGFYGNEEEWCPLCDGRTVVRAASSYVMFYSNVLLWATTQELLIERFGMKIKREHVKKVLDRFFEDNQGANQKVFNFNSFCREKAELCFHCNQKLCEWIHSIQD